MHVHVFKYIIYHHSYKYNIVGEGGSNPSVILDCVLHENLVFTSFHAVFNNFIVIQL